MNFNLNDIKLRKKTIAKIFENLQNILPEQTFYLYGSHAYGLADDKSNINIFIYFGMELNFKFLFCTKFMHCFAVTDSEIENIDAVNSRLKIVLDALIRSSFWKDVMREIQFNVPIVKATTKDDDLECSISFGSDYYVASSILVRKYIAALPMSKKFYSNFYRINKQHLI